jgi:hypothetical protein
MHALRAYFDASGDTAPSGRGEPLVRAVATHSAAGVPLAAGDSRFSQVTALLGSGTEGFVVSTALYDLDVGVRPTAFGDSRVQRAVKVVERWQVVGKAWRDDSRAWTIVRELAMGELLGALPPERPRVAGPPVVPAQWTPLEKRLLNTVLARVERWFVADPRDSGGTDLAALMPAAIRDRVRRTWLRRQIGGDASSEVPSAELARRCDEVRASSTRRRLPPLVMIQPRVDGVALGTVLRAEFQSPRHRDNLRRVVRALASLMKWLNDPPRSMVHGDLSPSNVMISPIATLPAGDTLTSTVAPVFRDAFRHAHSSRAAYTWIELPTLGARPATLTLVDLSRAYMPALRTQLLVETDTPAFRLAAGTPFYGLSRSADMRRFALTMCTTVAGLYAIEADLSPHVSDAERIASLRRELSVEYVRLAASLLALPASWISESTALLPCDAIATSLYSPRSETFGEFVVNVAHVVLFLTHVVDLIEGRVEVFAREPHLPSGDDVIALVNDRVSIDLAPYTATIFRHLALGEYDSADDLATPYRVSLWRELNVAAAVATT